MSADGYADRNDRVFIQRFEVGNLASRGDGRTYADLVTPSGLKAISRYAGGVGLCKKLMIPRDGDGRLLTPTPVIADAHRAGLIVHGWTFRRENAFLPAQFRSSADPAGAGDLAGEIEVFLRAWTASSPTTRTWGDRSRPPQLAASTLGPAVTAHSSPTRLAPGG